jgi:hypothetical protein
MSRQPVPILVPAGLVVLAPGVAAPLQAAAQSVRMHDAARGREPSRSAGRGSQARRGHDIEMSRPRSHARHRRDVSTQGLSASLYTDRGRLGGMSQRFDNLDSIASRFHHFSATLGNATSVTADTILVQDSEPISAIVQENIVLLSIRAGAYFGLNRTGGLIWNMLIEPRRVGEIFEVLAQTHDADLDTMTRDVVEFLDTLIKRQLVRVVSPDEIQ